MIQPRTPSPTTVLIATNLVPVFGVLFLDWHIYDIMTVFWLENIIIGLITCLKVATLMMTVKDFDSKRAITFTGVYVWFALGHGVFVHHLFSGDDGGLLPTTGGDMLWTALALMISHLFLYVTDFISTREYTKNRAESDLIIFLLARLAILHLVILLGANFIPKTGYAGTLMLLIFLKTVLDVTLRKQAEKRAAEKASAGDKV